MTKFTLSLSAFVPAAQKDRVNTVLEAMGFGPGNFSVPLSSDGIAAPTQYGLHCIDDGRMRDVLNGTTSLRGIDWADWGITGRQAATAIASVTARPRPAGVKPARENFEAEAATRSVKRMESDIRVRRRRDTFRRKVN